MSYFGVILDSLKNENLIILRISGFLSVLGRNCMIFGLLTTFSGLPDNTYSQNFFKVIVLSIITFGLYGIYWIYRKQLMVNGKSDFEFPFGFMDSLFPEFR